MLPRLLSSFRNTDRGALRVQQVKLWGADRKGMLPKPSKDMLVVVVVVVVAENGRRARNPNHPPLFRGRCGNEADSPNAETQNPPSVSPRVVNAAMPVYRRTVNCFALSTCPSDCATAAARRSL